MLTTPNVCLGDKVLVMTCSSVEMLKKGPLETEKAQVFKKCILIQNAFFLAFKIYSQRVMLLILNCILPFDSVLHHRSDPTLELCSRKALVNQLYGDATLCQ